MVLKEKDTGKPRSGLDWSKSAPTSLFYLPCQAKDPAQSFFIDYDGPERFPLDAVAWIENGPIPLQPESPDCSEPWADGKEIDQLRVQRAITEWRNAPKGMGNYSFFRLGLECKRAGMNLGQIETLLKTEAQFAHSRSDRKAQIPSILTSLQKGKRAIGVNIDALASHFFLLKITLQNRNGRRPIAFPERSGGKRFHPQHNVHPSKLLERQLSRREGAHSRSRYIGF